MPAYYFAYKTVQDDKQDKKFHSYRRKFFFCAKEQEEANVLEKEILEKTLRITDNEIEGVILSLYSFGFTLDLGCGSNKRGKIGIDIRKTPAIDILADGAHLPFMDNTFDCVISFHALEHIRRADLVLKEIKRVTRGTAIIAIPRFKNSFAHPGHIYHFKKKEFRDILSKHFDIEDVFSIANSNIYLVGKWVLAQSAEDPS